MPSVAGSGNQPSEPSFRRQPRGDGVDAGAKPGRAGWCAVAELIESPVRVEAAGQPPKTIDSRALRLHLT